MKRYVVKESILPEDESEAEKDETEENRMCKKDLAALLMMKKRAQWEEVSPKNKGEQKEPPENTEQ